MCGNVRNVHCDMLGAVGWTVFQRRQDGSVNFYRDYVDYIDGFGSADGEYWLGLDNIHCLTTRSTKAELLVDLADFEGNYKYARYSYFSVGNGDTGYRINTGGYSGTAGDGMNAGANPANGMSFTTRDHDADAASTNCATSHKGAWWYKACHIANLNGQYLNGPHSSYADGINWGPFRGHRYSLKYTEMKMYKTRN